MTLQLQRKTTTRNKKIFKISDLFENFSLIEFFSVEISFPGEIFFNHFLRLFALRVQFTPIVTIVVDRPVGRELKNKHSHRVYVRTFYIFKNRQI